MSRVLCLASKIIILSVTRIIRLFVIDRMTRLDVTLTVFSQFRDRDGWLCVWEVFTFAGRTLRACYSVIESNWLWHYFTGKATPPLRWLSFKAVCLLSYIWIETSLQGQELRLLQQPNLDPFMLLLAVNVLHVESQASTFISLLPQLCGQLNLPFHLRSACIALFKEFKSLVFDLFPKDNVIGHFVTEENRFQRNPASFSAAWVLFLRSSDLFLLEMSCESFSYLGRKGPESIRLHMF